MPKSTIDKAVDRILDANLNRAKEGLRVCEEIARFIIENRKLTAELKGLRHALRGLSKRLFSLKEQLGPRRSLKDVGFSIYAQELRRKDCPDIFFANMQRVKESLRVLEEFAKLQKPAAALGFKRLRYKLYEVERRSAQRFSF
ncbi:MAG: thiamine-phosphate pyrophosphorylase [Candidatus Omnitrophica bacterium]|nr:thiamine-phosphate pyrophosphorylase [Candidatus Omnitrophota bacterium]